MGEGCESIRINSPGNQARTRSVGTDVAGLQQEFEGFQGAIGQRSFLNDRTDSRIIQEKITGRLSSGHIETFDQQDSARALEVGNKGNYSVRGMGGIISTVRIDRHLSGK